MRTTVNIDDDVLAAARALAAAREISLGEALSLLARRGLAPSGNFTVAEGFPVFQVPPGTRSFGSKDVEEAGDSEDEDRYGDYLKKP